MEQGLLGLGKPTPALPSFLPGLGPPVVLTKAGLVTGLLTVLFTLPAASVPPRPLPPPEGGGESGRWGVSEKPSFIKAAGAVRPARPRRQDPLRCRSPHVTAPPAPPQSKLGLVPIHP